MKYSQQDKARILKITTRTLQRWKTSKPELYAIIEPLRDKKDDKRSLAAKLNLNPYRLEFDEIITPNLAEFNFAAVNPNFKIADRFNFDAVITQNAVKFNPIIIKTAVSQNAK